MMVMKQHQPSMTIEEQINNLKKLGLIIRDEKYAEKVLNSVSYFRLIKAYSLNLKMKNSRYNSGITFEMLVQLYMFNMKFRQIIFCEIEKIEISLRCRVANHMSDAYGVLGYMQEDNFINKNYHRKFLEDVKVEITHNMKSPFVKNFMGNYEGGELPVYALIEIFSFGMLSKFFKNLKNNDKKVIALYYGVGYTYLESWIESISYVRNICAHYGRLYNVRLSKTPKLYKEYNDIGNNRIFGVLVCMKHLLNEDEMWNTFVEKVEDLFCEYTMVDKSTMGFSENWKSILKNQ